MDCSRFLRGAAGLAAVLMLLALSASAGTPGVRVVPWDDGRVGVPTPHPSALSAVDDCDQLRSYDASTLALDDPASLPQSDDVDLASIEDTTPMESTGAKDAIRTDRKGARTAAGGMVSTGIDVPNGDEPRRAPSEFRIPGAFE